MIKLILLLLLIWLAFWLLGNLLQGIVLLFLPSPGLGLLFLFGGLAYFCVWLRRTYEDIP